MESKNTLDREIGSNDTIVAVLLLHRLADSRFAGYGRHNAGVIQLHSRDGSWASHRMVVSLGGSNGATTLAAGMLPVDRDQLHAALRVAEFFCADGVARGINDAVAAQVTHCVTDEEAAALITESRA